MRIVIAGAGDLGFHLAELLSYENQTITLIDNNQDVLDYAAGHLDVMTLKGDSSSLKVLEEAGAGDAQILLAVTTSETNNLMTAVLSKKLGAKRVIARVSNPEYLDEAHRRIFSELGVDTIFSPKQLAAKEIVRLVNRSSFTDIFEFEEGKLSLVGITIGDDSPLVNLRLRELQQLKTDIDLRLMAVLRGPLTIIPRGDLMLRSNDHIYFITHTNNIDGLEKFVGKQKYKIKNIMILGGSGLAYETAKLLENDYSITLIEESKPRCKVLAEMLSNTLIINGKADNIDLLKEEGLDHMDAFLALTPNSETNIIASLTAKNYGVHKTIAQVENKEYIRISQNIGVDTLINKKLIAANNIFRFVRQGKVEAITGLHGVEAEVIEYSITKNNQLTKKPLKELHFPDTALVGGVIRGEESMIPDGDFQLQLHDKVIIFAMPEAIPKVEKLFR